MQNTRFTLGSFLAKPRASWGSIDDVRKVVLYSRWSAHVFVIVMAFLGIIGWLGSDGEDKSLGAVGGTTLAVIVLAGVLNAAAAIAVLELSPQLNVDQRRPVAPFILAALIVHGGLWLTGIALYLWSPGWEWALAGIFMMGSAAICCSWGVLPWLKYPFVTALALGIITDVVLWKETGLLYTWFLITGVLVMRSTEWIIHIIKDLKSARDTEAQLQVSEERLRFAQELHDTMGQHLAAISLKAQLARALADRNDDRLDGELEQLQKLAGQSSDEMRRVVRGYRAINLATELRGARELLESAGIEVTVEGVSTDIPAPARDLCAWLVRESATNVLRHSSASRVSFLLSDATLRITNDGANPEAVGAPGGLETLQRKAEEIGATLMFYPLGDKQWGPSFRVECDVSAVAPADTPTQQQPAPSREKQLAQSREQLRKAEQVDASQQQPAPKEGRS